MVDLIHKEKGKVNQLDVMGNKKDQNDSGSCKNKA